MRSAIMKRSAIMFAAAQVSEPLIFAGLRILVTGATKGIGRATALRLSALGAEVIAVGRSADDLASLSVEAAGCVVSVDVDVGDAAALTAALAGRVGDVDALVNVAGIARNAPLLDVTTEDWDATIAVNTRSALLCTQHAARSMIARGVRGSVVSVSSQAASLALADHASYCASKAALDALTRQFALELGAHGIRANSVNPTVTLTEMAVREWGDPAKAGPMLERIPLNRFAQVDDVVDAVVFLLSDRAAIITGVQLPLDGGFTASPFNLGVVQPV